MIADQLTSIIIKSYNKASDIKKINKAIDFAIKYHGEQKRESGELYYYHPLEVAVIITNMKLDSDCVVASLLHDTLEDTDLTLQVIQENFGEKIAKLVDGVTKLSKIEFISHHTRQAANFRKFLLAMSEDIRVLLIKLADRLHNMRTIESVNSQDKKLRIALETMEIYAPLAERIGMQQVKVELQDICFGILQPDVRQSILQQLEKVSNKDAGAVDKIIQELTNILHTENIQCLVNGRLKTPYSIWLKMHHKQIGIEQLSDIIAFRIVVNDISKCYTTLGIIHNKYQMVPGNFQDFISTPKANDYRSLHTVVIGPFNQKIEIQIRTHEMHEVAEYGVAAHWRYKQQYSDPLNTRYRWMRELLAISEQSNTDLESFLENTKLAIHYDQVFCFTPKGALISLPKGATIVDFAYTVHSKVGNHCIGAKVNGKLSGLSYALNNGDQVEVLTSKNSKPSASWHKFVVTGKAHSEIKRFIRTQKREQYITVGRKILTQACKAVGIENNDRITEIIDKAKDFFAKKKIEELFYSIGYSSLTYEDLVDYLHKEFNCDVNLLGIKLEQYNNVINNNEHKLAIQGLDPNIGIHMAECCTPLLGEDIVGIENISKGITVHTTDCELIKNIIDIPKKLIRLSWDSNYTELPYICRYNINLLNEIGSLETICDILAQKNINITNLQILNRDTHVFEIKLELEVKDTMHAQEILGELQQQRVVAYIERSKNLY